MKHIHFLGIAGIGVSALAQLAQARGIRVSGSDPHADPAHNPAISRLQAHGATLFTTHRAENLAEEVDLVVASAAVGEDNPEIKSAQARGIRVVSRAAFLGELMASHPGPKIAVAGTHGKTTTTGMIGVLLQHAGLDPTVFVGGEVPELGGNVRVGSPEGAFVAEACEAYDSFLYLHPDIAVVTNIEADHLDHYGTEERVFEAFRHFLRGLRPDGTIIVCGDDPNMSRLLEPLKPTQKVLEYGMADRRYSGSRAKNVQLSGHPSFEWHCETPFVPVTLQVPGRHNVLNALAAATVGHLLQVPGKEIAIGLTEFHGATRRQDILGEAKLAAEDTETVLVIDDYAHHPTEITATLEALRSAHPERRLIAIFQPHLYSRTRDFLDAFAASLLKADALLVTDIYAAREKPIENVHASDIVNRVVQQNPTMSALYLPDKNAIPDRLLALARPNDLCVFMGAGDIREQGEAFVQLLHEQQEVAH